LAVLREPIGDHERAVSLRTAKSGSLPRLDRGTLSSQPL